MGDICPTCGGEFDKNHKKAAAPGKKCPYEGMEYPRLRAGHDRIYFGAWRKMESGPAEIMRAHRQIGKHLQEIRKTLEETDLPAAKRDLQKAVEAYHMGDPKYDSQDALRFMDHALSYAHRVIDDLLHEKGMAPHAPMDFAELYDAVEVPFREEW